jgi:hypothetical protein
MTTGSNAFTERMYLAPAKVPTISQAPPREPAPPAPEPSGFNKFATRLKQILDEPRNAWIGMNPLGRAASAGLGMLGVGQVAFHGSPHKFTKFLKSKIGTGEGAQAYGHGLYFAENPATAKRYAENVKDMGAVDSINAEMSKLSKVMDADSAGEYGKFKSDVGRQASQRYHELMDLRTETRLKPGLTYKVDLPDEAVGKMLDWHAPLDQQPVSVRKAIEQVAPWASTQGHRTGEWLVGEMSEGLRGGVHSPELAERLRAAGIPGISYLDQASRDAGAGSRNFVVFEEELPTLEPGPRSRPGRGSGSRRL